MIYYTTKEIAQKEGQTRIGDPSYRPFITFRLNDTVILALDWPEELSQDDAYVQAARSLFYSSVTPALTEVFNRWPRNLDDSAGIPQLQEGISGSKVTPVNDPSSVSSPARPVA